MRNEVMIRFLRYSLEIGDGGWGLTRNKKVFICQLHVCKNKHFKTKNGLYAKLFKYLIK